MSIEPEERRWREAIRGIKLEDRELTEEELFAIRKQVIAQWKTGKEIEDIGACIEYSKNQPWHKFALHRLRQAKERGETLWLFSLGHATFEYTRDHIVHNEYLEPAGWVLFADAYTRKSQFEMAKIGMERSYKEDKSLMSGYPIVTYGVEYTRKINDSSKGFFFMALNDEDPRLQAEIAYAAGFTCCTTYSLSDLMQHSRDYPLENKIQICQYMSRLEAYYTAHGAPITPWCVANITGYDEMGMKAAIVILQSLLAARQGIKSLVFDVGLSSHLITDVATLQIGRKLTEEYFERFGYKDVEVFCGPYAYLGAWPKDKDEAQALAAWGALTAIWAGCEVFDAKAVDEASGTTKYGSEAALKLSKRLAAVMGKQRMPESAELALEREMLEKEIRAIVDKTLEMGDGDVAVGMVRAVNAGVIDISYSCWTLLKGDVLVVRDSEGAIRYLEHGNIPLPKEVIEYHRQKIDEKGDKSDLQRVIDSVTYCSRPL